MLSLLVAILSIPSNLPFFPSLSSPFYGVSGENTLDFYSSNYNSLGMSFSPLDPLPLSSSRRNVDSVLSDASSFLSSLPRSSEFDLGFYLIFEGNKYVFNHIPDFQFVIVNQSYLLSHDFEFRIISTVNSSSPWSFFNPLNLSTIYDFQTSLRSFWNITGEGIAIICEFRLFSSNETSYRKYLFKDLTAPTVVIGFSFDENGNLIPNGEEPLRYYNSPPTVYLNITDVVPTNVSIYISIANTLYLIKSVAWPKDWESSGLRNLTRFILPGWDYLRDGLLQIPFYMVDDAGNSSPLQVITFIKDVSPPLLKTKDSELDWIVINGIPMNHMIYYRPGSYVPIVCPTERPFFQIYLDDEIQSVKMSYNLTQSFSELSEEENLSQEIQNQLQNVNLPSYSFPLSAQENLSLYGVIDGIYAGNHWWNISFPSSVWDLFLSSDQNVVILITLEVQDLAGNAATFSFSIEKPSATHLINPISNIELFLYLFLFILSALITSVVRLIIIKRHAFRHPLDEDLKKFDRDLLDVVIPPPDKKELKRILLLISKIERKMGKGNVDFSKLTHPQFQKILRKSYQLVDLKEIRDLLTRFQMDEVSQEEFLREMLSLSPEDRMEFLEKYMFQREEEESEPSLDSFLDEDDSLLDDLFSIEDVEDIDFDEDEV